MTARADLAELLANALFAVADTEMLLPAEQTAEKALTDFLQTETDWLIHNGRVYRVEEVRDGWPDDGRHFWELVTTEEGEDEAR